MDWFTPLIALPGQALLILSTSNFTLHLYDEIRRMKNRNPDKYLIMSKMQQLRILNLGLVLQYLAVMLFILSAIVGFMDQLNFALMVMITALICFLAAMTLLIKYSVKAYKIRLKSLKL